MLAEVAFRGMVSDFSSNIEDLPHLSAEMLLSRLQDVFLAACRAGKLQAEEVVHMTSVVFGTMDCNTDGKVVCREFMEACTNDGEISMQKLVQFFHRSESGHSLRKFLDDTHLVTSKTAEKDRYHLTIRPDADASSAIKSITENPVEDSSADVTDVNATSLAKVEKVCEDDKAIGKEQTQQLKPPGDAADHRLECTVADLERRLQEQEQHCEQALGLLRDAFDRQVLTSWRRTRTECPMLSPRSQAFSAASASTAIGSMSSGDPRTLAQKYTLSRDTRVDGSDSTEASSLHIDPPCQPRVSLQLMAMGSPRTVKPTVLGLF